MEISKLYHKTSLWKSWESAEDWGEYKWDLVFKIRINSETTQNETSF